MGKQKNKKIKKGSHKGRGKNNKARKKKKERTQGTKQEGVRGEGKGQW